MKIKVTLPSDFMGAPGVAAYVVEVEVDDAQLKKLILDTVTEDLRANGKTRAAILQIPEVRITE